MTHPLKRADAPCNQVSIWSALLAAPQPTHPFTQGGVFATRRNKPRVNAQHALEKARKAYQHALVTRTAVKDAEKRLQAAKHALMAVELGQ